MLQINAACYTHLCSVGDELNLKGRSMLDARCTMSHLAQLAPTCSALVITAVCVCSLGQTETTFKASAKAPLPEGARRFPVPQVDWHDAASRETSAATDTVPFYAVAAGMRCRTCTACYMYVVSIASVTWGRWLSKTYTSRNEIHRTGVYSLKITSPSWFRLHNFCSPQGKFPSQVCTAQVFACP